MSSNAQPKSPAAQHSLLLACGLMLVVPMALAKPAPPAEPDGPVWEGWQPMAEGFIARRKVPAKHKQPVAERATGERSVGVAPVAQSAAGVAPTARSSAATIAPSTLMASATAEPAVWLYTDQPGLHAVSLEQLAQASGLREADWRRKASRGEISITNRGKGVSWDWDASQGGRVLFAAEDYESFLAEGNAYRLTQTDKADPLSMTSRQGRNPKGNGDPTSFREQLHLEQEGDMLFSFTWVAPDDPDARYAYWATRRTGTKIEVELDIPEPAPTGQGELVIRLQGLTDVDSVPDEHRVVAKLNGVAIGETRWDGLAAHDLVARVDQSLLNSNGTNQLTIEASADTVCPAAPKPCSAQALAWVDVAYDRQPVAGDDGQVWLRETAGGLQAVSGFAGRSIMVIESPVEGGVVRKDVRTYRDGNGWAVAFEAKPGVDYLVAETTSFIAPMADGRSIADLLSPTNAANYLIIAAREFPQTAAALAAYREPTHGPARVVWLDEIFKAFGDGLEEPVAISRFMAYADEHWTVAPTWLTLVGKGSLDRKNRQGYDDNYLPIAMTSTPWALAESDHALLGDPSGGTRRALGRLPLVDDADGVAYVDKLMAYEGQFTADGVRTAVVAADRPDDAGEFHVDAGALGDQLGDLGFSPVARLFHPNQAVRSSLQSDDTWEAGIISYSGHGSALRLGLGAVLMNVADATALSNSDHYALFSALTCGAGSYAMPGSASLGTAMVLNPSGGAIAAMAPSGLSLNTDAHRLGAAFVDRLYGEGLSLGEALRNAKADTEGEISDFMPALYSITGDPGFLQPSPLRDACTTTGVERRVARPDGRAAALKGFVSSGRVLWRCKVTIALVLERQRVSAGRGLSERRRG
jgi:hypothetical protein